MKILVLDSGMIVTSGEYVETDTEFVYPHLIVPKNALMESYQQLEVDVPEDFLFRSYRYVDGQFQVVSEEPTQPE